jgi:hypothetical protein
VVLADPPRNLTLSWSSVSLLEAEAVGRRQAQALGVKRVVPLLEGTLAPEDDDDGQPPPLIHEPLSTLQDCSQWPGPLKKLMRSWQRCTAQPIWRVLSMRSQGFLHMLGAVTDLLYYQLRDELI